MREIYERTRKQGVEYCGSTCRMSDGNGFTYDTPEHGPAEACNAKPLCPDQSQPVGFYHSHPDLDRASDEKMNTMGPPMGTGQPGYMIDPQGNMKKWHRGKQWDLGCIFP